MTSGIRTLAMGALALALLAGPAAAQQAPDSGAAAASKERLKDAEVDFVDSEHAVWNTRTLNDTIFYDGLSVNSVMLEKSSQVGKKLDVMFQVKVEDVQVNGPMGKPTVVNIEGREIDL